MTKEYVKNVSVGLGKGGKIDEWVMCIAIHLFGEEVPLVEAEERARGVRAEYD